MRAGINKEINSIGESSAQPYPVVFLFMETEIWLPVVGYEGLYEVSNFGRVKNLNKLAKTNGGGVRCYTEKILRLQKRSAGYAQVGLRKSKRQTSKLVHRLVAAAFIPNPENKPCVNHKNSNRFDNRVENLEWCTPAENLQHAIDCGNLKLRGADHGNSILDEEKVREMRRLRNECGMTNRAIAKRFGIREDTASLAIRGKTWGWLV
jgi:hypothetical protein